MAMSCTVCDVSLGNKRCGRCRLVAYCCKKCQISDWSTHKFNCSKKVQVLPSSEHGMGLFARKRFAVGDELIRESPIIIVPNAINASDRAEAVEAVERESCRRFEALSSVEQRIVMRLSDNHRSDNRHANSKATTWGVLKTNCIFMGAESGIFLLACRINHACVPNARYVWRADLNKEVAFALRPIAVGEEITVQYMETYCSRATRKIKFQTHYNFICRCRACVNGNEQSDERLCEIRELIDQMPSVAEYHSTGALKMCENVLCLLKVEDRDTPLDTLTTHFLAYQIEKRSGHTHEAEVHLRAALVCANLCEGVDSPLAIEYARLL